MPYKNPEDAKARAKRYAKTPRAKALAAARERAFRERRAQERATARKAAARAPAPFPWDAIELYRPPTVRQKVS